MLSWVLVMQTNQQRKQANKKQTFKPTHHETMMRAKTKTNRNRIQANRPFQTALHKTR
jgi:hypothetical protein